MMRDSKSCGQCRRMRASTATVMMMMTMSAKQPIRHHPLYRYDISSDLCRSDHMGEFQSQMLTECKYMQNKLQESIHFTDTFNAYMCADSTRGSYTWTDPVMAKVCAQRIRDASVRSAAQKAHRSLHIGVCMALLQRQPTHTDSSTNVSDEGEERHVPDGVCGGTATTAPTQTNITNTKKREAVAAVHMLDPHDDLRWGDDVERTASGCPQMTLQITWLITHLLKGILKSTSSPIGGPRREKHGRTHVLERCWFSFLNRQPR